jgi:CubicO group peptidase (beta-lactamase class C family)
MISPAARLALARASFRRSYLRTPTEDIMPRAAAVSSLLLLAALAAPVSAQEASPSEALAFSSEGLAALDAHFAAVAEAGTRSGFVIGVARNGEVVHTFATGLQDIEAGTPMAVDTRFRLASMTKPLTVAAVLKLADAGKVDIDDPVSVYIPTMANMLVATSATKNAEGGFDLVPPDPPMTIRHLMTHTSGLGYTLAGESDLDQAYQAGTLYDGEGTLAQSIEQLSMLPLYFQPGERWSYSWGVDVLGRVVEVASGMPFEDYLRTEIFEPLGMTSTHFFREPADAGKLATVYAHAEDGALTPSTRIVFGSGDETWPSGGGGVVSTMPDYLRFASMLAGKGALGDARILSPEAVALMGSPQLAPEQFPEATFLGWSLEGRNFGLGVQVTTDESLTPQVDRNGDFGWNGAYGTDFFASPSTGVAAVVMQASQGGPTRPQADVGGDLRRLVYEAMAE